MSARTIETQRTARVLDEVDVVVVGGGVAGVAAAVRAARAGARTMLVERGGYLGGVASAGLMTSMTNFLFTGDGRQVVRGVCEEVLDRTESAMEPRDDHQLDEFAIQVGRQEIVARLLSPSGERLHHQPALLLSFALDRETTLSVAPYSLPAQLFLGRGHRALSLDLPNHGQRADEYGSGIVGLRNAFVAGQDRFGSFVEEAKAVIDRCVELGVATPNRIAVCGTSRGGYFALRLLAADPRVAMGAAFAPVTDWSYLAEFGADRERDDVADLGLSRFVDGMVGKPVYLAIGNHDDRVSTVSCCRLYLDLLEANRRAGHSTQHVDLICTPDPGHTLSVEWNERGSEFLLRWLER